MKKNYLNVICSILMVFAVNSMGLAGNERSSMSHSPIGSIVAHYHDFSILEEALIYSDMMDDLSNDGSYTLFAPSNSAFELFLSKLGVSKITDLPKETVTNILRYHLIQGKVTADQLSDNQSATTLNGKEVVFTIGNSVMKINESSISATDMPANNGVIHVVNQVICPPSVCLIDFVKSKQRFSIFVKALEYTGLKSVLENGGPYTVFVPTNTAFKALFRKKGVNKITDLPKYVVANYMKHHVLRGSIRMCDLRRRVESAVTLNNEAFLIKKSVHYGSVFINTAKVITPDVAVCNGIVHAVDKVITPTRKVGTIDKVLDTGLIGFSYVTKALKYTGLDSLLATGKYTFFAPEDFAFRKFLRRMCVNDVTDIDKSFLTEVLSYHIIPNKALLSGHLKLRSGSGIKTVQGDKVFIYAHGNVICINKGTVLAADLLAKNGVIHVIDRILYRKRQPSLADKIMTYPNLSILKEALIYTGLMGKLRGHGPFTVFAPDNTAFRALLYKCHVSSITDLPKETVTNLLLYHVIGKSINFHDGRLFRKECTLQGSRVLIYRDLITFTVNLKHLVTYADIPARNGSMHIINCVLIPHHYRGSLADAPVVKVQQNPFHYDLGVDIESADEKQFSLTLRDSNGNIVSSQEKEVKGEETIQLPTNGQQSGTYYLEVKYDDNAEVIRLRKE